jgi:hypothetical protein
MRGFRVRAYRRALIAAVVMGVAMAVLGFGGTPASALNHSSYNILKNAGLHNYCLDIKSEDKPESAGAQLWTCTRPVVPEQQFLLLANINSLGDNIQVKRSGYCLQANISIVGGTLPVTQEPCAFNLKQFWLLQGNGQIYNQQFGRCLDVLPADTKGADIVVLECNNNISQRWFF